MQYMYNLFIELSGALLVFLFISIYKRGLA